MLQLLLFLFFQLLASAWVATASNKHKQALETIFHQIIFQHEALEIQDPNTNPPSKHSSSHIITVMLQNQ